MSKSNPSSLAHRLPRLGAAGLVAALTFALPAVSGELYQWKDANGVTHYSDAPPPAGADYKNRTISNRGSAAIATDKAEAPAESSQCTTARGNLALLQGEGPVGTDADSDGKPDAAFTADERAAQTQLAEAAIKVHCNAGAATANAEAS
ncbi:MAG: DUF4124 domain-containing protein [Lysobacter sp.]